MMTISMSAKTKNISGRPGIALLVVLFIVMVITITVLGFVSQSDVELACGRNMILRTEMDYLAESGLEHARGLILNPQDTDLEYWTGAASLQLIAGSGDYYDLDVIREDLDPTDRCNYIIDCNSYRLRDSEKIGRSSLRGELRIDPCIAYWVGSSTTVRPQITINGDVYCDGNLTNNGVIDGDVFATGTIAGGSIEGRKNESVVQAPVVWPGLESSDFSPYYIGSAGYLAEIVDANTHSVESFNFTEFNPAGIYYCESDVNMPGDVDINGMLVVEGNLKVSGANNIITSVKNFPALLVTGQVVMEDNATLVINGLAQIGQGISIDAGGVSANVDVVGGLFVGLGGITSDFISVNVTAAPAKASIETWPSFDTAKRWSPAAGAFFRNITRK